LDILIHAIRDQPFARQQTLHLVDDTALDNNEILHHPLKDASSKPQAIIILKASSL